MALVNRLADFREQYNISEYELSSAVQQTPSHVKTLEKPDEMEEFLREVNILTKWIDKIKAAVKQISANNQLILVTYNHSAAKEENSQLMHTVTELSRKVNVKLNEIKKSLDSLAKDSAIYRSKLSQYNSLFSTFTELLSSYNAIQEEYRDKSKECIEKQLNYAGQAVTEEELSRLVDTNTLKVPLLSVSALQKSRNEIETRQTEIQLLEQNIIELRDMFYDIAVLVEEQGQTVDRISMNIELAHEYVSQGNLELDSATVYHDNSKKLKWCLCGVVSSVIVLFIIVIIIVIVVVRELEKNKTDPANNG